MSFRTKSNLLMNWLPLPRWVGDLEQLVLFVDGDILFNFPKKI